MSPSSRYGEALQRLRTYVKERKAMLGLDPELIHGLHSGTEREAELLLSDIESVLSESTDTVAVPRDILANAVRALSLVDSFKAQGIALGLQGILDARGERPRGDK